jgi:hypothetical protein
VRYTVSLAAALLRPFGVSFSRPTPWQRGFWRDPVHENLTLYGCGFVVIAVEGYIKKAHGVPSGGGDAHPISGDTDGNRNSADPR